MSQPKEQRGNRQRIRGVVVRDKGAKTVTVEVVRRFRHRRYGKMVRKHKRLAAHDPQNEAHLGDTVEIMSCRPISKTKRYRLVRIVEKSPGEALVGQPPARPEAERAEAESPGTPEAETPQADAGPVQEPMGGDAAAETTETTETTDTDDAEPDA